MKPIYDLLFTFRNARRFRWGSQHEDRDVFRKHEGLSKAHRRSVAMHGKVYTIELMSLRRRALHDDVNFMNFAFWIKTLVFNFIVLLSYRAIRIFLLQKFSCPVATHGHAT
jgi:hypothetical protein